jgi:WD40 repeat protein/serine/threonine protein kinase/tetratricopeptide (TPR) repeat protein
VNESQIFTNALNVADPAERAAYLNAACAGAPELRTAVEALLRAQASDPGFLEQPAASLADTADGPAATATAAPPAERPGLVLAGRYKLLEEVGEGGMGTVWMAQQQEPVKRLVAVKLIKPGMDSRQVLARFEAERQALALMDHPNIAKVHDAGAAPDGRPFFVMELVKGTPITRYCDDHHLTPRQRLELFVPVCHAVQHAHQKGVIHRDLKPSNVQVARYDDKPVPKVIDFGVAKATGQPLTEQTLHTGFGAVVGTVEYMSPEQATFNQLDVDTRSDVYSLGVLLYELLAGSPPFSKKELERAGMLEMLRVIREQEPSKPSTKLSTADGLPTLAANRGTEPGRLTKLVRGELDWIVMKALEKDRGRRYETANGFAMDVQRYLADETVQACPPSVGYRLRKMVRRNKRAALAVSLIAVALVCGIAGTTLGLVRARAERDDKERARDAEAGQRAAAEASLYRSLVSESRSLLLSGREGWRAKALENLRRAAQIETTERDLVALRTDAAAVLAGFDAERLGGLPTSASTWSLDFSPDSNWLVTANYAGSVDLWDVRKGLTREHQITSRVVAEGQHMAGAPLPAVRFHPDGKQFAYVSWERSVEFCPLPGRNDTLTKISTRAQPRSIAFDRRGTVFAVSWSDGQVVVYEGSTGKPKRQFPVAGANEAFQYMSVALTPDGELLATLGSDNSVVLFSLASEKEPRILGRHADRIRSLCFSPDGRFVASASKDRTAKIWNVTGGEPLILIGHKSFVNAVAFNPQGDLIATGSDDTTVRLWDRRTGQTVMTLPATEGSVLSVGFSPDGSSLCSAGHSIDLYRLRRPAERPLWQDIGHFIHGLDFHPRQPLLAAGGEGILTVIDLKRGEPVRWLWLTSNKALGHVSFNSGGTLLVAGSNSFYNVRPAHHDVHVFDPVRGQVHCRLKGHSGDASSVDFDAPGRHVAAGGVDGSVIVWDVDSGKAIAKWNGPTGATTVRFLGDGPRLVVWYLAGRVELRDPADGRLICAADGLEGRPETDERSAFSAVSPDEKHLAVPCRDGAIRLVSLSDLQVVKTFAGGHDGPLSGVAFSPDGRWFATAGEDRTIILRSGRTFEKLLSLPRHVAPIRTMAFGSDGSQLASAGDEQQITISNLDEIVDGLTSIGLGWGGARQNAPSDTRGDVAEVIPTSGVPHFVRGNEFKAHGKLEECVEEYEKGLALDPKNLDGLWTLWRDHQMVADSLDKSSEAAIKRHYKRADAILELIASVASNKFDVWWAAAKFYEPRFQWDALIDKCAKALSIQPENYWALNLQAIGYAENGNYERAWALFTSAEKAQGGNEWAWENRARLSLVLGNREAYREDCAGALRVFPDSVWAPYFYALGSGSGIDSARLVQLADRAAKMAPTNLGSVVAAGTARYRADQFEEALKRLNAAGTRIEDGWGSQVWFFLAMTHHRLGHAAEAKEWLTKATQWQEQKLRENNAKGHATMRWSTRVEMQVLRREAEALILGKDDK